MEADSIEQYTRTVYQALIQNSDAGVLCLQLEWEQLPADVRERMKKSVQDALKATGRDA